MTFSHDDIRERLVDFLYGELDAEARAAFDTHVKECEACRGDVTLAEEARRIGRAVARAPLGDEVPARARMRASDAARAAAAVAMPAAVVSQTRPGGASGTGAPRGPGWFERLRGRWTLPTFATVAAMAALLLVRGTIFREAKQPLGARSVTEPGPPPSPEVAPAAPSYAQEPAAAARRREDAPKAGFARPSERHRGSSAGPRGSGDSLFDGQAIANMPGGGALVGEGGGAGPTKGDGFRAIGGLGAAASSDRPIAKRVAAKPGKGLRPLERNQPSRPGGSSQTEGVGRRVDVVDSLLGRAASDRDEEMATASTPPAGTPQRQAAPPSAESAAADDRADQGRRSLAAPAPSAPAAAAPPEFATKPPSPAKKAKTATADSTNDSLGDSAGGAARAAPADAAADSVAALVRRADAAMAARRWNEAAALYGQLVSRYPAHVAVPAWRKKLAAVRAAIAADTGQFAAPPP